MENLPAELLIMIALEFPEEKLWSFCRTNKKIWNKVCANKYFWLQRSNNIAEKEGAKGLYNYILKQIKAGVRAKILEVFLDKLASFSTTESTWNNILSQAIRYNRAGLVRVILSKHLFPIVYLNRALSIAADKNFIEVVKVFLLLKLNYNFSLLIEMAIRNLSQPLILLLLKAAPHDNISSTTIAKIVGTADLELVKLALNKVSREKIDDVVIISSFDYFDIFIYIMNKFPQRIKEMSENERYNILGEALFTPGVVEYLVEKYPEEFKSSAVDLIHRAEPQNEREKESLAILSKKYRAYIDSYYN